MAHYIYGDCGLYANKKGPASHGRSRALLRLWFLQQRNYLEVLVLVVLLVVSPFLFFLCLVLVFTVPLDMVSWLVDDDVLVFWAKTAVLPRRERPSEAIMIFFIKFIS